MSIIIDYNSVAKIWEIVECVLKYFFFGGGVVNIQALDICEK